MLDVDEGRCVIWVDVLVFLLKNVVFNDFDCVLDVNGYVLVVWLCVVLRCSGVVVVVKLNKVEFGGYGCVSEIDDVVLLLLDVVLSNVDNIVVREFCFVEVMELNGIDCDCVGKNDVFFFVEFIDVIGGLECNVLFENVDMCDVVVFIVVEIIG